MEKLLSNRFIARKIIVNKHNRYNENPLEHIKSDELSEYIADGETFFIPYYSYLPVHLQDLLDGWENIENSYYDSNGDYIEGSCSEREQTLNFASDQISEWLSRISKSSKTIMDLLIQYQNYIKGFITSDKISDEPEEIDGLIFEDLIESFTNINYLSDETRKITKHVIKCIDKYIDEKGYANALDITENEDIEFENDAEQTLLMLIENKQKQIMKINKEIAQIQDLLKE